MPGSRPGMTAEQGERQTAMNWISNALWFDGQTF
jgi:hypothetical protein